MKVRQHFAKTKIFFSNISLKQWLIGGGVLAIALYAAVFFIPKNVQFSYATETCIGHFALAPDLMRASSDTFDVQLKDPVPIGNVTLFSKTACFTPREPLEAGVATASISPFGGWIGRTQFNITVPDSPAARTSDLEGKSISTALPLKIMLTSGDIIHQYSLNIADKSTACEENDAELSCDIVPLRLEHGAEYTATLHQTYKDSDKKLAEGTVQTLQPLALKEASVSEGQVIYEKPTQFSFTFDQPVTDSDVTLVKVTDDTTEPVQLKKELSDATLKVSFAELARESNYRLTIKQAVGESGSSLADPLAYTFQTSGGPKVKSVSVGSHSVGRTATIVVTLDQPVDESADLAALAKVEGVAATIRRQSDTEIAFTIRGGDCSAFTLVIDKGLKSGSNGELSKEPWNFASRTICGYSWSIGQSVQGRPIIAYSFGSGATTLLFTGAIHGSEPSSYSTMLAWAQHLQAYGDIIPADKRVVIVPNTNPDGIAVGSRNNSRNVNLGRNFPTANWKASIETASGTLPTGGGTSPGSEPEAAALITLTRQLRPRLEVSFHAQGSLVGANKFADSVAIGDVYARTVRYATMYYDAEAVMGYPMTGEYEDWMGEEMGIPAILIELPTHSGNYISSQLPALKKLLAL